MHSILCNITEDVLIYFVSHCYSVLKFVVTTPSQYRLGVSVKEHVYVNTLVSATGSGAEALIL